MERINNTESFNESDLYFKIGNEVPIDDVNLAYIEVPEINEDNINIINTFHKKQEINFITKEYVPNHKHILSDFYDDGEISNITSRNTYKPTLVAKSDNYNITMGEVYNDWTQFDNSTNGADWKYDSSNDYIYNENNQNGVSGFYNPNNKNFRDYNINFTMYTNHDDDDMMGFAFRFQDNDNFYSFEADNGNAEADGWSGGVFSPNGSRLFKYEDGKRHTLDSSEDIWQRGVDQDISIEVNGTNFKVYMDGSLILEADDDTFNQGAFGPISRSQPDTYFKYLDVDVNSIYIQSDERVANFGRNDSEFIAEETYGELLDKEFEKFNSKHDDKFYIDHYTSLIKDSCLLSNTTTDGNDHPVVTKPDGCSIDYSIGGDQKLNNDYIDFDNFLISNLTNLENNMDGLPLYYKYKLRYLHKKKNDDLEDDIHILDKNKNMVDINDAPYEIEYNYKNPGYEITLLLTEFYEDTHYVIYNPKYNPTNKEEVDIPDHYLETLKVEPLFKKVDNTEFYNNKPNVDERIYTIDEYRGRQKNSLSTKGFQIKVPHKAEKESQPYLNVSYIEDVPKITKVMVWGNGYPETQENGLLVYFVYDHSASMVDHFDSVNSTIENFINKIDQDTVYEPLFNVLYYTYSSEYGEILQWEYEDGEPVNKQAILSLSAGSTDLMASGATNTFTAYRHALEKMIYHRNTAEHRNKHAVIITMTDGNDNRSRDEDIDYVYNDGVRRSPALEEAMENGIESFAVGYTEEAEEVKAMAETLEYHYFTGLDIDNLYEDLYDSILSEVYVPIYPGHTGQYVRSKEDLPEKANHWVSDKERIIVEDIPLSYQRLNEMKIGMEVEHTSDCIEETGFLIDDNFHFSSDKIFDVPLNLNENNKISIFSRANCFNEYYSRLYFIKEKNKKDDFKLRLKEVEDQFLLEVFDSRYRKIKEVPSAFSEDGFKKYRYTYKSNQCLLNDSSEVVNAEEEYDILNPYTIQTRNYPVVSNNKNTNDKNQVVLNGITIENTNADIIDWDLDKGIFTFNNTIVGESDTLEYTYKKQWCEYDGFYFSDGDDISFVPFDLNPQRGHTMGKLTPQGIEYIQGSSLANNIVYIYMKPNYVEEKIDGQYVTIPGSKRESTIFHTVGEEINTLNYPMFDRKTNEKISIDEIIEIGRIFIEPESDKNDMKHLDTRTRGGGIFPGDFNKIKEINPEVNYYWDIGEWNGKAYPSNAVIVIEIPSKVLITNGGYLTKEQVEEKIEKHLALGVAPIIKYV